ncbi:MAG: FAD-dependent oxidoreductase [Synechococcus sp.]|nr:FAD-dependent oxidoreductase [Synechococcus sp.]
MDRREFLRLLSLVLLGSGTSAYGAGRDRGNRSPGRQILIIGAGLAGLAAARELGRHGHESVVLEARDRIGGRIFTSNRWPDLPLDLGATWIHGVNGNPITAIADQIGARRLITTDQRAAIYNTNGAEITAPERARLGVISKQMQAGLRKAQNSDLDASLQQTISLLEKQLANSTSDRRFLSFCLSSEIEHEYAGSARQLSTHWFDSDKKLEGDDALFAQGYKAISDYLAEDMDIRRSQIVQEIHWQRPRIRVLTTDNEYFADRVVITLPLGVLQHKGVKFIPELPATKLNAINKLGMGVLNKCCLRFAQVFWPEDIDWLQYVSAQHGEWTEWVSYQRAAQMPVLVGFNAADRGRQIEAWSDEQIVASAMETLRTIFGAGIPYPIDHQITRWAADPFARGSYSFPALGSTPEMRNLLARPVDRRLFFAGEATNKDFFATAHGAYWSGLRAAKELLAS